ncbi:helix-turn-helix domain-containing protein [Rahnella aceris]|uniref:transcriptional regulator n=1 Tax=Rahnella sp. (strain Y9602) TaxID=2703885 RepID=UPI0019044801|nr:YdaS family helix-turn-helix protein [Rahnella aceris]QQN36642.1 helix-turn-helix domain-containing protein [Rahnella aceris]
MQLKQYISSLKRGGAKELAEKLGVSKSYLSQMASGASPVPPSRCLVIEGVTGGVVTRADLRPKDWENIWPDFNPENNKLTHQVGEV